MPLRNCLLIHYSTCGVRVCVVVLAASSKEPTTLEVVSSSVTNCTDVIFSEFNRLIKLLSDELQM